MLQWINDRVKVFGWLIIAPLALVFAVWGVHGLVDFTTRQDRSLTVDGHDVDLTRLRQSYQEQMAQVHRAYPDAVPPEVQAEVQKAIVDQYVNTALLDNKVAERGFNVSDKDLIDSIQALEPFQVAGKFNLDAYKSLLRTQGYSEAQFEAEQRKTLRTRQLEGGLYLSSFATRKELERNAALRGETRELAWATLPLAKFLAAAKPDDAALHAYYDAHKADFMTAESVTLAYVRLTVADVSQSVPVDEPALRAYYDKVKDRYVSPEKRRARHILIQAGKDPAAAAKKAQEVYALATRPGADFAAFAKQYSQDAGSAAQGGDLGWAEKSFFVGPFADALFAMQPGTIKGPVQTQFGWHVIKLEEIQAGAQKSFDEARAEIEVEYRRGEAERMFGERQEQLDQLAFENGGSLAPAAKAVGMPVRTLTDFTRAGGGDFGPAPKLVQAAFSAEVLGGQNSRAIELAPGDVIAIRVSDHKLPAQQAFEAVRAKVEEAARRELALREARAAADKVAAQLAAGAAWDAALAPVGKPFVPAAGKAAPADALQYQAAKPVTRDATGVAPEVLAGAFRLPAPKGAPSTGVAELASGDLAVYAVSAVKPGVLNPADVVAGRRSVANARGQSDLLGYLNAMRDRAEIHYSPTIFE